MDSFNIYIHGQNQQNTVMHECWILTLSNFPPKLAYEEVSLQNLLFNFDVLMGQIIQQDKQESLYSSFYTHMRGIYFYISIFIDPIYF